MASGAPPKAAPTLHVRGAGPTVLLLHGLGASSHVWAPLIRQVGTRYRTITVDLPYCGAAEPWAPLHPRKVARALLPALGGEEPLYVVGHSFGGVVALELAALVPERLSGLCVVAAPAMGLGPIRAALGSRLAEWTMALASVVRPSTAAVRSYLKLIWGQGPQPTPSMIHGYLWAMAADGHHRATLEALRALASYRLPAPALRRARLPTALLFGADDPLVSPAQGEALAAALGAPLRVLGHTGHCIPEERPEVLAGVIQGRHARSRLSA